ncbi:hypothetical protein Q8A73_008234 [Channa argus]|nr:hypothetical protein Q8A73_008234 [Channa argus]
MDDREAGAECHTVWSHLYQFLPLAVDALSLDSNLLSAYISSEAVKLSTFQQHFNKLDFSFSGGLILSHEICLHSLKVTEVPTVFIRGTSEKVHMTGRSRSLKCLSDRGTRRGAVVTSSEKLWGIQAHCSGFAPAPTCPVLVRHCDHAKLDPKTPLPHTCSCSSALSPKQPSEHIHLSHLYNSGVPLASEEVEEEEYVSEATLSPGVTDFTAIYRDAETITAVEVYSWVC